MATLEQIYHNIITQSFKWVKITDTEGTQVGYLSDSKNKKVSAAQIKTYVHDFVQAAPGTYTFTFKKSPTASRATAITFKKVHCGSSGIIPAPQVDLDEIREQVRAELKEEERQKEAFIDYSIKAKELDMVEGKLWYVLEKLINKFVPGAGMLQGNLNGTSTMGQNTDAPIPLNELSKEQKDLANQALQMFLTRMSPELFHRMAEKIYKEPDKIPILKSFL